MEPELRILSHRVVWLSNIVLFCGVRLVVEIIREGVSWARRCVIHVVSRVTFRGNVHQLERMLVMQSLR